MDEPTAAPAAVATVRDLVIAPSAGGAPVVDGVGFTVAPGEIVGFSGRSGSGKSTTALALFGHLRPGLVRVSGDVRVGGDDPFTAHGARAVRGHRATHLGQDPAATLNPARRLGVHLAEAVRLRAPAGAHPGRAQVRAAVRALLDRVSLPGDSAFLRRFPHQVSGGQARRVALAAALAGEPALVVLDEPSAGLDPVVAADVRAMLSAALTGRAAVLVSHDARLLDALAHRVLTLRGGRVRDGRTRDGWVRDAGPQRAPAAAAVVPVEVCAPAGARTSRAVVAPRSPSGGADGGADVRGAGDRPAGGLVVEGLVARHGGTVVVDGVSLAVPRGDCLALVGPSGSGKTTVARCIAGLHRPASGRISAGGRVLAPTAAGRDPALRRAVALVAQDSVAALNPVETVAAALARPLRLRGVAPHSVDDEIDRLLARVHLPVAVAGRRPGRLSGGERQRVNLARALAAGPEVLVCDEITSALDRDVAAVVVDLVDELRRAVGLTVLTVTHDPEAVRRSATRAVLVDRGRVRSHGGVDEVLAALDERGP